MIGASGLEAAFSAIFAYIAAGIAFVWWLMRRPPWRWDRDHWHLAHNWLAVLAYVFGYEGALAVGRAIKRWRRS